MERKIYFYALRFVKDDAEILNPLPIFTHIQGLPDTDAGKYYRLREGDSRSMRFVAGDDGQLRLPLRAKYGKTMTRDLPYRDLRGNIRTLALQTDEGLYEPMHFIIFPQIYESPTTHKHRLVAGFEYNHKGPRPTGIREYIEAKAPSLVDSVEMLVLQKPERSDVSHFSTLSSVTIKLHKDYSPLLEYLGNDMPDSFSSLAEASDADEIEITFRATRAENRVNPLGRLKSRLDSWVSRNDVQRAVRKVEVYARPTEEDRFTEIDLLEERLLSITRVPKTREDYDAVESDAMFLEISRAYRSLSQQINRTMGLIDQGTLDET